MKLDKILRKPQVLDVIGVSDPTIWRWERQGKFPKRVQIGPGSVGWFESEIITWMEQQSDKRHDNPKRH